MEIIYEYTSKQAAEDGQLFDVRTINPAWGKGNIAYVTSNLMKHYMTDDKPNIPNLIDLLTQSQKIIFNKKLLQRFNSGKIEFPSGKKQQVWIVLNEEGKYTVMFPEDY